MEGNLPSMTDTANALFFDCRTIAIPLYGTADCLSVAVLSRGRFEPSGLGGHCVIE
jgi:hypothetical protein